NSTACERIAAVGLAAILELVGQMSRQLAGKLEQGAGVALLQFQLDLADRLAALPVLRPHDAAIERAFDSVAPRHLDQPGRPPELGSEARHQRACVVPLEQTLAQLAG